MPHAQWFELMLLGEGSPALRSASRVRPKRRLRFFPTALLIATSIVAAQTAGYLADYAVWSMRVEALNANSDASVVAWLTPVAMGAALIAAAVLWLVTRRRPWAVISLILLALVTVTCARRGAFDLGSRVTHSPVLLLPMLALLLLLLLQEGTTAGGDARRILRLGCGLLVASYCLRLLGGQVASHLGWDRTSWPYQVKVSLKEGSEVGGWILIAAGLWLAAMQARRRSLRFTRWTERASRVSG
jgi:hypothetical protein